MRLLIMSVRMLITAICYVVVFTALPNTVTANGAVWSPGAIPGTPGPIRVNDLVLIDEYVLFDTSEGIVSSQFWIHNPTKKDIQVAMGFPLHFDPVNQSRMGFYDHADSPSYQSHEDYLTAFSNNFTVKVNDANVPTKYILEESTQYPVLYTWDMTFPAQKTIKYTVKYPLTFSIEEIDKENGLGRSGLKLSRSFMYITNTRAYWAGPIKSAKIEYCDKELLKLMKRAPTGELCAEKRESFNDKPSIATVLDRWSVKPKPYRIDADAGCIVWLRKDWTPRIMDDDIVVQTLHDTTSLQDVDARTSCQLLKDQKAQPPPWETEAKPTSIEKDVNLETMFKKWCAVSDNGVKAEHFGVAIKITDTKLSGEIYHNMWGKAFYYPDGQTGLHFGSQFAALPADTRAAFQMQLLRYLRNYIYAFHGHVFQDQHLAQCFNNVSISSTTELSEVEKWNAKWLLDYEKQFR